MKSGQRLRLDLELAEHHKSNQNRVVRRDDFDVSGALRDVLQAAKEQDRIICGIYESAEKLRSEPESLMMCILPCMTNCSDIVLQIHLTLIKAFCLEQDIKLIQIDDTEQLRNIISGTNCNHSRTGNDVTDESTDFNCVLIQHPIGVLSDAESRVLSFHAATFDLSPQPVVRLHTDAGPDRLNCILTVVPDAYINKVHGRSAKEHCIKSDLKTLVVTPADFLKTPTTSLRRSVGLQPSTLISPSSSTLRQSLPAQLYPTDGRRRSLDQATDVLSPSKEGNLLTFVTDHQRLT